MENKQKPTPFITPVSMICTEEQYQIDLKAPLKRMGYDELIIGNSKSRILLTNKSDKTPAKLKHFCDFPRITKDFVSYERTAHNRYFIDHYNPELFLALAAMTGNNLTNGGIGEWWVCCKEIVRNRRIEYNRGGLYKCSYDSCLTGNSGEPYQEWTSDVRWTFFYKASAEQLIKMFSKNLQKASTLDKSKKCTLSPDNFRPESQGCYYKEMGHCDRIREYAGECATNYRLDKNNILLREFVPEIGKVFLGGTCADTTWRKELISLLVNVPYFNPVVEDWTPKCQQIEGQEKEFKCDTHFYCITKEMQGVFSIAEAVDSVHNTKKRTIFQVIPEGFDEKQLKSLQAVVNLISSRGGIAYIDSDLNKAAKLLNNKNSLCITNEHG